MLAAIPNNPPPSLVIMDANIHVRVYSGDVGAALLRPHQVLLARDDAALQLPPVGAYAVLSPLSSHGSQQPDGASISMPLELRVARVQGTQGGLRTGCVQVHPWVLDALQLCDGDAMQMRIVVANSSPPSPSGTTIAIARPVAVVLGVAWRYPMQPPPMCRMDLQSESQRAVAMAEMAALAQRILPESVRTGHVSLHRALARQLGSSHALAHAVVTLTVGALIPVQLMGETFVFRVLQLPIVTPPEPRDEQDQRHAKEVDPFESQDGVHGEDAAINRLLVHTRLTFHVIGVEALHRGSLEDEANTLLASGIASLQLTTPSSTSTTTTSTSTDRLAAALYEHALTAYRSCLDDVLFHILLNFRALARLPSAQLPSLVCYGIMLQGVEGVGKSLALRVLAVELEAQGLVVWRVDAMSLLMEYEASKTASAYEFLRQQFMVRIPGYGQSSPSQYQQQNQQQQEDSGAAGVVLIDDIDVLFRASNGQAMESSDAEEGRTLSLIPLGSALLRLLDAQTDTTLPASQRLCLVGATTRSNSSDEDGIPSIATRAGRFDKVIEMIVPTEAMRRQILVRHLQRLPLAPAMQSTWTDTDRAHDSTEKPVQASETAWLVATRLAALTGGYVAKDLVRICRNAYIQAHSLSSFSGKPAKHNNDDRTDQRSLIGDARQTQHVSWDHLVYAQRHIKPSQLQQLNVASPSATEGADSCAHGFAGYAVLRRQLVDFIHSKFHPSAAMTRLGVGNASSVLIHGPSGCGKSLLIKSLAAQARVSFVSVKSSELLSKYFGDSEQAVRQLFARARAASPCLLFFDEFDAIAHKRSFGDGDGGGDGSGVYARILSTFLNEMDGVGAQKASAASVTGASTASRGEVLVVAATNRFDALDAALVRPGRIDKVVELGFPADTDRTAILRYYTRAMPLADDVELEMLSTRSMGDRVFTGAELAAVCKEAAFRALREDLDARNVALRHFHAAWDQRV